MNIYKNLIKYINEDYNESQLDQIRRGLEQNLDVEVYAKKEYSASQMEEIRSALLNMCGGYSNYYAKPEYSRTLIEKIWRLCHTIKYEKVAHNKYIEPNVEELEAKINLLILEEA